MAGEGTGSLSNGFSSLACPMEEDEMGKDEVGRVEVIVDGVETSTKGDRGRPCSYGAAV